MKKISKKDQQFIKMLNAERKYRDATGGKDADEPFITPILFSLLDSLDLLFRVLCIGLGVLLTLFILRG